MKIEIEKQVDIFLVEKYWIKVNGQYEMSFTTEAEAMAVVQKLEDNYKSGKVKREIIYSNNLY